jgi:hypothetical protein
MVDYLRLNKEEKQLKDHSANEVLMIGKCS